MMHACLVHLLNLLPPLCQHQWMHALSTRIELGMPDTITLYRLVRQSTAHSVLLGEQIDDSRTQRNSSRVSNPPGGRSQGLW